MSTFTFDPVPFEQVLGATIDTYRLEQVLELNELGPTYLARGGVSNGAYRIRLLTSGGDMSPQERAIYLQRAGDLAAQLVRLQHPNILPVVDFGTYRGLPYLVYPNLPLRPLSTRLAQSGPLDPVSAGRYLDQVARALEYAHERSLLHRDLSTDCIYLQMDGQVVVGDFGVRRMIELAERQGDGNAAAYSAEACAPEQLVGGPIGPATDVYALGAALYRLLTGSPVYAGDSHEEVAEQHLRAPVPSLGDRRGGLPRQLDGVIATAMAKNPEERFSRPGALADAYARIVAPGNTARVPFSIGGTAGARAATSQPVAAGPSFPSPFPSPLSGPGADFLGGYRDGHRMGEPATMSRPTGDAGYAGAAPPGEPARSRPRSLGWGAALLIVVLVAAAIGSVFALRGAFGPAVGASVSGQVIFQDAATGTLGHSDAVRVVATHLSAPPSGSEYDAWLINSQTERVIALGKLAAAAGGGLAVSYASTGEQGGGTNLIGAGDLLEITLEHGHTAVPGGNVVLRGAFPPEALVHIRHVLVAFPTTPGNIGLLVGTLQQTQLLGVHAQALQKAVGDGDAATAQCEAQAMLDVLEGTQGSNYRPLSRACGALVTASMGDGFGLLVSKAEGSGYIAGALDHTALLTAQPDTTAQIRAAAPPVVAALNTVQAWEQTIDRDAAALVKNPSDTSKVGEIATLASNAYNGLDANHDGKIDPTKGEGGALTAYQRAQLLATVQLTAPAR